MPNVKKKENVQAGHIYNENSKNGRTIIRDYMDLYIFSKNVRNIQYQKIFIGGPRHSVRPGPFHIFWKFLKCQKITNVWHSAWFVRLGRNWSNYYWFNNLIYSWCQRNISACHFIPVVAFLLVTTFRSGLCMHFW